MAAAAAGNVGLEDASFLLAPPLQLDIGPSEFVQQSLLERGSRVEALKKHRTVPLSAESVFIAIPIFVPVRPVYWDGDEELSTGSHCGPKTCDSG